MTFYDGYLPTVAVYAQIRSSVHKQNRQHNRNCRIFSRVCGGLSGRDRIISSKEVRDSSADARTFCRQHPKKELKRWWHDRHLVQSQRHFRQQRWCAIVCRTRPNCTKCYWRQLPEENCWRFHVEVCQFLPIKLYTLSSLFIFGCTGTADCLHVSLVRWIRWVMDSLPELNLTHK